MCSQIRWPSYNLNLVVVSKLNSTRLSFGAKKFIMAEAKFIVAFLVQMGKKSYSVIF